MVAMCAKGFPCIGLGLYNVTFILFELTCMYFIDELKLLQAMCGLCGNFSCICYYCLIRLYHFFSVCIDSIPAHAHSITYHYRIDTFTAGSENINQGTNPNSYWSRRAYERVI